MSLINLLSIQIDNQYPVTLVAYSVPSAEACELMKLTAQDLFKLGVIERIIREPKDIESRLFDSLKNLIADTFEKKQAISPERLIELRYNRFRKF